MFGLSFMDGVLTLFCIVYVTNIVFCVRVGKHKGGNAISWGFATFFFPVIANVFVFIKRPRGFWKYIKNWATEQDFLDDDK